MNTVLREEKKFLMGLTDFYQKRFYLEQLLHKDPHNGVSGYKVRSLYFDTPYDTDFNEKEAGVELRRKIRLRIYSPDSDFAMLEMKQKQGAQQRKRSLRLSRARAQGLIEGDYSQLLRYQEPFAAEIYGLMMRQCYLPKTIVEYNRTAFIAKENKTRITFDRNVVSTESDFNLFSPRLNMAPVLDPAYVIMEVKFNGFLLSYIRDALNSVDRSELSVSKYVLARQHACLTHI